MCLVLVTIVRVYTWRNPPCLEQYDFAHAYACADADADADAEYCRVGPSRRVLVKGTHPSSNTPPPGARAHMPLIHSSTSDGSGSKFYEP